MKVFISWSGEYSREVAEKLNIWLPSVLQSVDVFFSHEDIGKGENWDRVLTKELEECNFGIICLTPENVSAPWVHFEAGSLANAVGSRVSSIMLGINASDIKGPLSRFQNTKFERNDFYRLTCSINNACGKPLREDILEYSFEIWWKQLESDVSSIIEKYKTMPKPSEVEKKDNDAIQEILGIVRKMSTEGTRSFGGLPVSDNYPKPSWTPCTVKFDVVESGSLSSDAKNAIHGQLSPDISDKVIRELEDNGSATTFLELDEFQKLKRALRDHPGIHLQSNQMWLH